MQEQQARAAGGGQARRSARGGPYPPQEWPAPAAEPPSYGAAPSPGAAESRGRARAGGAPAAKSGNRGAVGVALVVPPLLGAAADSVIGSGPGWALAVGAVLGGGWATVLAARRRALWWVVPLPPLVVAAVTVGAGLLGESSGKTLTTDLVRWAVAGFPAMAAAECAVLAVLAVRGLAGLGRGRRGHG
ncbi:DUF6542 domain-containing protein [Streptomyces sp. NPDC057654]|uniref:DUF6542 domain-containing protein n=1 Tax=Streptomyces sp. NPDC057654 TaxID=3346196 RepID=UPI00367BFAC6